MRTVYGVVFLNSWNRSGWDNLKLFISMVSFCLADTLIRVSPAFPVVKDLSVDRSALDRIVGAAGLVGPESERK